MTINIILQRKLNFHVQYIRDHLKTDIFFVFVFMVMQIQLYLVVLNADRSIVGKFVVRNKENH